MSGIELEARRRLLHRRRALLKGSRAVEQSELAEIELALSRIEKGVFGRCEICGGPIGQQRLRAIPEAHLCSACSAERRKT